LWEESELCDTSNEDRNYELEPQVDDGKAKTSEQVPGDFQLPVIPPRSSINSFGYTFEDPQPTFSGNGPRLQPDFEVARSQREEQMENGSSADEALQNSGVNWMSFGPYSPSSNTIDPDREDTPPVVITGLTFVSTPSISLPQTLSALLIFSLGEPAFPDMKEIRVPSDVRDLDPTRRCDEVAHRLNPNTFFMDEFLRT
jgi:hypothetical protein